MRGIVLAAGLLVLVGAFAPAALAESEWTGVEGFRSAEFGMSEAEVRKAIAQDFGKKKDEVAELENTVEKTTVLGIEVEDLIPESGPANVYYILGYKSDALIQVNVIWHREDAGEEYAKQLAATARILQKHFAGKPFPEGNAVANVPAGSGRVVAFQGGDAGGRTVSVVLNLPADSGRDEAAEGDAAGNEAAGGEAAEGVEPAAPEAADRGRPSLVLSYIANPGDPDVYEPESADF